MHIAFTLITAQVLGSVATICARLFAPDNLGPGDVFPDFSYWRPGDPLSPFLKPWFYVGLICQLVICAGYFMFFRKVQHSHSYFLLSPRRNWCLRILNVGTTCETITFPFNTAGGTVIFFDIAFTIWFGFS
jgi:hypothetical protein